MSSCKLHADVRAAAGAVPSICHLLHCCTADGRPVAAGGTGIIRHPGGEESENLGWKYVAPRSLRASELALCGAFARSVADAADILSRGEAESGGDCGGSCGRTGSGHRTQMIRENFFKCLHPSLTLTSPLTFSYNSPPYRPLPRFGMCGCTRAWRITLMRPGATRFRRPTAPAARSIGWRRRVPSRRYGHGRLITMRDSYAPNNKEASHITHQSVITSTIPHKTLVWCQKYDVPCFKFCENSVSTPHVLHLSSFFLRCHIGSLLCSLPCSTRAIAWAPITGARRSTSALRTRVACTSR